ncbi:PIN domain-containing protein [Desulfonema magnum]|uniref:PIN domain-containing protein n=1 Tax=Desulfonema magnum TaxID=45655 RepID=A0A975GSJ2_9BACT|nr:PIN domain-containing protein [Desulfonema magnum]QTA92115.1 PIN domain-containing protein [Desulfonema magnum]
MTYLWDTDTCVYFLNGNEKVTRKARDTSADNICTTMITIAELKFGAFNSSKVSSNLRRIEELQSCLTVLDEMNDEITTIFGKNKAMLKKQGITIGDFDLLIASFAIYNNLIVVTNNTSHFGCIRNVRTENWVR